MITFCLLLLFYNTIYLEGFSFHRIKRDDNQTILYRIQRTGYLNFSSEVVRLATERRTISCFFVFDKDASDDLNNNLDLANAYATQLAFLASKYTAHANIIVKNAGTEIWADQDRISFNVGNDSFSVMTDIVKQFQIYLNETQQEFFGKIYAVGVLISKKNFVQGGYSQGPPCTTSGVSLINYRQIPWSIGGLLAHELAHTLSVVHPFELSYLCQWYSKLEFCQLPNSIPKNCTCDSDEFPAEQCLMTFQFGQAAINAPRYTTCDIQMMNYFSSNISCLI